MSKKYYGQWEITKETPSHDEQSMILTFAPDVNDKGEEFPLGSLSVPMCDYDRLVTNEAVDFETHTKTLKLDPIIGEILDILEKHNICVGIGEGAFPESDYILGTIDHKLKRGRDLALRKVFEATPPFQTIQKMNEILRSL